MYCPTCGQQQISSEIRFCSRCGFLLSDIAEVVANKGISPYKTPGRVTKKDSPRKRGIKQGGMIMLVGCLLIVPIFAILTPRPLLQFLVPLSAIISFMGGLLRIIYAFMFEEKDQLVFESDFSKSNTIGGKTQQNALPPSQSIPVSDFVPPPPGSWQTTNDLVQPPSVTDNTTKLLQKED